MKTSRQGGAGPDCGRFLPDKLSERCKESPVEASMEILRRLYDAGRPPLKWRVCWLKLSPMPNYWVRGSQHPTYATLIKGYDRALTPAQQKAAITDLQNEASGCKAEGADPTDTQPISLKPNKGILQ